MTTSQKGSRWHCSPRLLTAVHAAVGYEISLVDAGPGADLKPFLGSLQRASVMDPINLLSRSAVQHDNIPVPVEKLYCKFLIG